MDHASTIIDAQADGARRQALALALFDGAARVYDLPGHARRLVRLAAAYYASARQSGVERPDRAGRDMVLAAPIDGLSAEQQSIVASAVAFQREKLKREHEPSFVRLDAAAQELALQIGAILGLAEAIAAADGATAWFEADASTATLVVDGPRAERLAAAAADLTSRWARALGPLSVRVRRDGEAPPLPYDHGTARAPEDVALSRGTIELSGDEPLREGARRMLRRFFEKMLAREHDVRSGEDPEDVHQMRVATRRLRASLQVVESVYDRGQIRDFRRKLRQVAAALGAVRDSDVFLSHLRAYQDTLPEAERAHLLPLIQKVEQERARARAELLDDLDAKRYTRFKRSFAEFLTTPGAAAPGQNGVVLRVRDGAGSLIWRRYEELRAHETVFENAPDETLHQIRIVGKRLRYTLEFFADALGPKVDQVLDPLADLQETLGALQDGVVARAHVQRLGLGDDRGARAYLAARDAEHAGLQDALPQRWDKVRSATYRRRLMELIVKM